MNRRGQISVGDLTGFVALFIVITFVIIAQLQFRVWERVTKQLGVEQEQLFTAQNHARGSVAGMRIVGNNHARAININASLLDLIRLDHNTHVNQIHYGRPSRAEEEAKRRVRKALR